MKLNIAERLMVLFHHMRGEEQGYRVLRKRPNHSCYRPYRPNVTVVHPRSAGQYGFQWNGKNRRPAETYRAARMNAKRGVRTSILWRNERRITGETRRDADRYCNEASQLMKKAGYVATR